MWLQSKGQQAWNQGAATVSVGVWGRKKASVPLQRPSGKNSLLFRGSSKVFYILFRTSADWIRPTHTENILALLSLYVYFNVSLIQKQLYTHIQSNVWLNIWASYGVVKLTYKQYIQRDTVFVAISLMRARSLNTLSHMYWPFVPV